MPAETRFRLRIMADRVRSAVLGVPMECWIGPGNSERQSPREAFRFDVGGRPALLCYGRPSARGRSIFGGLVPYGDLWRTGADEPTVLHLPFRARVAGIRVPRGRYAIYTVPGEKEWTVVVNRSIRQSGRTRSETGRRGNVFASAYTEAVRDAEVGRASVESIDVPFVEQLTAGIDTIGPRETILFLEWERTRVRIPIRA